MKDVVLVYGGGIKIIYFIDAAKKKKPHWEVTVITSDRLIDQKIDGENGFRDELEKREIKYVVTNHLKSLSVREIVAKAKISFCIGGPWIFDKEDIERHKVLYNLHATRLPAYRGGACYSWQILADDYRGGVTLHNLDQKIDGGDILLQDLFQIPIGSKVAEFEDISYDKTRNFIDMLFEKSDNFLISLKPTEVVCSTMYMPRLNRGVHAWIDWSWSSSDIEKFIRAFSFSGFGAFSRVSGKSDVIQIVCADLVESEINFHPFQSGIVFDKDDEFLYVACVKGVLKIKDIVDSNGCPVGNIVLGDRFYNHMADIEEARSSRYLYSPDGSGRLK